MLSNCHAAPFVVEGRGWGGGGGRLHVSNHVEEHCSPSASAQDGTAGLRMAHSRFVPSVRMSHKDLGAG